MWGITIPIQLSNLQLLQNIVISQNPYFLAQIFLVTRPNSIRLVGEMQHIEFASKKKKQHIILSGKFLPPT
jgi:hypothetical protein